ncbi:MAG: molybdate ABC transporter substrate-binding protein [Pseudomonadota bacterium]
MARLLFLLLIPLQITGLSLVAQAETLRVAVAANFRDTLLELQPIFESESGDRLTISAGSTGVLTNQITLGAPFDILLAADTERPAYLIAEGHALGDSLKTYALGRLALITPHAVQIREDIRAQLLDAKRIAIANPKTAPYGAAALQVLDAMGVGEAIAPRLVLARNASGALASLRSGAAEVGFVALSALHDQEDPHWLVPADMHAPLRQQAVILNRAGQSQGAKRLMAFLTSEPARDIIAAHGYGLE